MRTRRLTWAMPPPMRPAPTTVRRSMGFMWGPHAENERANSGAIGRGSIAERLRARCIVTEPSMARRERVGEGGSAEGR